MSDESLDNLFKKGLSGKSVAFNMESWRKMEQLLPAEPQPAGFMFGTTAAVIGTLLVLSASVFIWTNTSEERLYSIAQETSENSTNSLLENDPLNQLNDQDLYAVSQEDLNNSQEEGLPYSVLEGKVSDVQKGELEKDKLGKGQAPVSSEANVAEMTGASKSKTGLFSKRNVSYKKNVNSKNQFFANNEGFSSLRADEEEALVFTQNEDQFVAIEGLEELTTFSLESEDDHTLFAEMGDAKLPKLKQNEFGFVGGLTISSSLVNSQDHGPAGCELLGVSYQHYLKGGFSIMANLLYAPRVGLNTMKTSARNVDYSWGSVTEQTTLESERLVYLDLPLMINYNLGNHNFMAGPSVSYLVTGLHKVTKQFDTQLESQSEEAMEWGYTDGYKTFDFAIAAGYEYSVKPQLNLGLRLNYGLSDVTNNQYFGNDSFDNNVQFRIYLKYAPFQF